MRTDEYNQQEFSQGNAQGEVRGDGQGEVIRARDAARISTLMGAGQDGSAETTRTSIPMPSLQNGSEEGWNAQEAMTLEGYQRLRKGYERGINPEALERMEEHQESVQQFPPPAPSYAESTAYSEEPVAESTVAPMRIEPETYWEPSEQRSAQRGRIGPIAVTLILLVSITCGLLLYAGGAEYLSGLFRSGQSEPEENLTLVTERPQQEGEVYADGVLTPGEEMELSGGVESEELVAGADADVLADADLNAESAAQAQAELDAAEEEAKKRELQLLEERKAEEARKKKAAEALAERQAKEEKKRLEAAREKEAAAKSVAEESTPRVKSGLAETTGSGAWTVQVMATPDKAEADRVARALRSKGGQDVHVIVSDKADGTIYRVRFGAFDSQPEAKTKAGALGYSNIWIVKK